MEEEPYQFKVRPFSKVCKNQLENYLYGGRITLPVRVLQRVIHLIPDGMPLFQEEPQTHMLFKISEPKGNVLYCGVLEFTAPIEEVFLPDWMLTHLNLNEDELVKIEHLSPHPPVGVSVVIRPLSKGFSELGDPKSLLEAKLQYFSVISVGEILPIRIYDEEYSIEIIEAKPEDIIDILNCDLEVVILSSVESEEEESEDSRDGTPKEGLPDLEWTFGTILFIR